MCERTACTVRRGGAGNGAFGHRASPSPYLINQAIIGLAAPPSECALIGDTNTDIQSAGHAGIASIGYANQPGKHASLIQAGAQAVVSSLADLVLPLRAR